MVVDSGWCSINGCDSGTAIRRRCRDTPILESVLPELMMIEKEKENKPRHHRIFPKHILVKVECRGCGCKWWMTEDDLSDWDSPESVECQECL